MLKEIVLIQLKLVSSFGNNYFVIFFTVLIFFLILITKKHYISSLFLLFTNISYPISIILKDFFKYQRPDNASYITFLGADKYSFPSSHVVYYTVFWGFILYLTFKFVKDNVMIANTIRYLAIYLIIFIGSSRIILRAHYIKDVMFGYIVGALLLIFFMLLDKKTSKMFPKYNN
ncbi:hypothetical protein A2V49_01940 [candidate division WWE3 bacterium RBG_19FT_COMBO_34_6]|uniref:Phosphatidic acid phosphatase type 2/haloperoxidase domain-containing protein n=1 Tax=candidate division WWE3 bacterium RBG_19FT_COMBO_34_6 TaxID=1802612 RepID=A0A1F4UM01_UNCKA|nr:MAG: hypothetical protein A2V49_01940 [candidate division WWE3 bacterium RBG_19FT_COMBO_34_6]